MGAFFTDGKVAFKITFQGGFGGVVTFRGRGVGSESLQPYCRSAAFDRG